jgi:putative endonuclease
MYILKCADDSFYTGSTFNLEKRILEHNQGLGGKHTNNKLPISLIYCEEYDSIDDAFKREKQIKGWSHAKKHALANGELTRLRELSRKK